MAARVGQSFSFHQSPEAFIARRLQELAVSHKRTLGEDQSAHIITAQILNRNVHLVSSYDLCRAILCNLEDLKERDCVTPLVELAHTDERNPPTISPNTFTVAPAYEQLMVKFFPHPNVLLDDGEKHSANKTTWKNNLKLIGQFSTAIIQEITSKSLVQNLESSQEGMSLDLYETMKALSWDALFAIFLGLSRDKDKEMFRKVEELQEAVLRGQFSLFPMSIQTPFWVSARSRGLKAVQDLGPVLKGNLKLQTSAAKAQQHSCPFTESLSNHNKGQPVSDEEEIVSHLRLFTSSIANKAIASLLTAYFLNIFLWRDPNAQIEQDSIANLIAQQTDPATRTAILTSVLKETMRLSPPVIGVMRRTMQEVRIKSTEDSKGGVHEIPPGHDVWLYFVAANRDPAIFDKPNEFIWNRFMHDGAKDGITFGLGAKSCLGVDLCQRICLTIAETVLASGIVFSGSIVEDGVKSWLGWSAHANPEAMAKDLKQLPCQRPRRPVMVRACLAPFNNRGCRRNM